jgi:hypothetical protein
MCGLFYFTFIHLLDRFYITDKTKTQLRKKNDLHKDTKLVNNPEMKISDKLLRANSDKLHWMMSTHPLTCLVQTDAPTADDKKTSERCQDN